jgi:hypothetical protein
MGVEILGRWLMEEPRDDRDEGPLPLIDSVSLLHENDREVRVACCGIFFVGEVGGVYLPIGIRWSTSLCDRLSLRMASLSSIVAQLGWGVVVGAWYLREREGIHSRV